MRRRTRKRTRNRTGAQRPKGKDEMERNTKRTAGNSPAIAGARALAALGDHPERKTRRVQLLIRPSTWEAVEKAADAAGYSRNDWAEVVLSAAASAALTPGFIAHAEAEAEKPTAKRRERTQPGAFTKADLVDAAAEKLGAKF